MIDTFKSSPITDIRINGDGELINQFSNKFSSLKTITLNEGITKIGENVFVELTTIESIIMPSTLKSIDGGSIQKCYKVNIHFPDDNLYFKYNLDYNYVTNYEGNSLILYIDRGVDKILEIQHSITTIGSKVFSGNSVLETLIIHEELQSTLNNAFYNIPNLKEIQYYSGKVLIPMMIFHLQI